RFTSFAHSASPPSRNRKRRPSTKTRFVAPTTQSRFPHSFRRASMIGLFKRCIARIFRLVARLRVVFVSFGALAIAAMLLWTGFGVVFNYTHSAPFGLYREQFDSEAAVHSPAPYV